MKITKQLSLILLTIVMIDVSLVFAEKTAKVVDVKLGKIIKLSDGSEVTMGVYVLCKQNEYNPPCADATNFLKPLLIDQTVRVEFDSQVNKCVYIYLKDTGKEYLEGVHYVFDEKTSDLFVNATMIASGFAVPLTKEECPDRADYLTPIVEEAIKEKRGNWSTTPGNPKWIGNGVMMEKIHEQ